MTAVAAALLVLCGCSSPLFEEADFAGKGSGENTIFVQAVSEVSREGSGTEKGINSSGQTYGSALDVELPSDFDGTVEEAKQFYPDLIAAQNSDGVEGYITVDDFFGDMPSSPEKAVQGEYRKTLDGVTLFDKDGKTTLGTM